MSALELSELLGNWGEFLGSIAVFATLIYLAIQVKQSKQATEANNLIAKQSYEIALAQNHVSRAGLISHLAMENARSKDLAAIWAKYDEQGIQALNAAELNQFSNANLAVLYILESQYVQYSLGLLDDESWADAVRRIKMSAEVWADLEFEGIGRTDFVEEIARVRAL